LYSFLPLGQRSLNKIIAIVREEMDKIGQEFLLPALNPAEIWQESGRWTGMGENMFRLKDRKGADLCLGMTHEEVMTSIARGELRSYKQLPQIWYQIQTKFRDEPRPKSGLLRVRQFIMKDAYSFDIDAAGLDESYNKHDIAYRAIFTRCGLEFVAVEADSGAMGGSQSQEFMVYTEAGEDLIASSASGYAANLEMATSKLAPVADLEGTFGEPDEMHTPGARTIEEVSQYLNANFSFEDAAFEPAILQRHHQIKTMAYVATFSGPKKNSAAIPVVIFLRGDHSLNEAKLAALIKPFDLRMMVDTEIERTFNAPAGYLGPVGLNPLTEIEFTFLQENGLLRNAVASATDSEVYRDSSINMRHYWSNHLVILDSALEGRANLIAGANKEEYHLRNVTPGRDFKPTLIADIRNINEGELDPIGGQPLRLGKAVEIGHIFKLGYKYSESMGASVLNADGKEVTPIMGSYGIGIERILTAAIESSAAKFKAQFPDVEKAGEQYALPAAIAPFEVVVTITNVKEAPLLTAGETLAAELSAVGLDVLLDDRDERAGVKFKDAELIGIPYRINIGKKLAEGKVELVDRLAGSTTDITLNEVAQHLKSLVASSKS
jgi:prolyl-tRNA synthetase